MARLLWGRDAVHTVRLPSSWDIKGSPVTLQKSWSFLTLRRLSFFNPRVLYSELYPMNLWEGTSGQKLKLTRICCKDYSLGLGEVHYVSARAPRAYQGAFQCRINWMDNWVRGG